VLDISINFISIVIEIVISIVIVIVIVIVVSTVARCAGKSTASRERPFVRLKPYSLTIESIFIRRFSLLWTYIFFINIIST
jgi:hypothetical protein